jgi:hypothetical protein
VKVPPGLSLATALPLSVWQDHLVPMLIVLAAARLKGVCKALRAVVNQYPVNLQGMSAKEHLSAALSTFPAVESMEMTQWAPLEPAEESNLVALLGEHGSTLKRIVAVGAGAERLLSRVVAAGALSNLKFLQLRLSAPDQRRILLDGRLDRVEEIELMDEFMRSERRLDDEEQRLALGHLRRLPHLRRLFPWRYLAWPPRDAPPAPQAAFPPSLKSLTLCNASVGELDAILRRLPGMLQGSGARLEEITVEPMGPLSAEGGAAIARVLHLCSSRLRKIVVGNEDFQFSMSVGFLLALAPGRASCSGTKEQHLVGMPLEAFQGVSPPCTSFKRLTHLMLHPVERAMDLTSPIWDLFAGGLFPALCSLNIVNDPYLGFVWGHHEAGEGACRLLRALEGVAGTLTRLDLANVRNDSVDPPHTLCFELGVAIGKLRRLRTLSLSLFHDGRAYHALARGLAASGGCPELLDVELYEIRWNVEWLTYEPSLILPSVRHLDINPSTGLTEEEELLLWCGVVQMRREHRLEARLWGWKNYRPCADLASLRCTLLLSDICDARYEGNGKSCLSVVWGDK